MHDRAAEFTAHRLIDPVHRNPQRSPTAWALGVNGIRHGPNLLRPAGGRKYLSYLACRRKGSRARPLSRAEDAARVGSVRRTDFMLPDYSDCLDMAKKRPPTPGPHGTPFSFEQLSMPVTFDAQNYNIVTLGEVLVPPNGTVPLPPDALTTDQWFNLAVERISRQPEFVMVLLEGGWIDQTRAIQELTARSDVGQALVEVQRLAVQDILERAARL